jgi:hypothetical protein
MHSFPDSHSIMGHNFVVLQLNVGLWSQSNVDIRKFVVRNILRKLSIVKSYKMVLKIMSMSGTEVL